MYVPVSEGARERERDRDRDNIYIYIYITEMFISSSLIFTPKLNVFSFRCSVIVFR
jgi:hypothetical protein